MRYEFLFGLIVRFICFLYYGIIKVKVCSVFVSYILLGKNIINFVLTLIFLVIVVAKLLIVLRRKCFVDE